MTDTLGKHRELVDTTMGKTCQMSGSQASIRTAEKQFGENTKDRAQERFSVQGAKLGSYQKAPHKVSKAPRDQEKEAVKLQTAKEMRSNTRMIWLL